MSKKHGKKARISVYIDGVKVGDGEIRIGVENSLHGIRLGNTPVTITFIGRREDIYLWSSNSERRSHGLEDLEESAFSHDNMPSLATAMTFGFLGGIAAMDIG